MIPKKKIKEHTKDNGIMMYYRLLKGTHNWLGKQCDINTNPKHFFIHADHWHEIPLRRKPHQNISLLQTM